MSRARDLSRLTNSNAFSVGTNLNVGIGSTTPDSKLDVAGNVEVSGVSTFSSNVNVGTGITMYSSTGIVSATSFRGDGSALTGITAGATLSAASGTQRVVVTSQTTGTMTASATDADITFDATSNTLFVGAGIGASSFLKQNAIGIGTTNTRGRDAGIGTAVGTVIFNNDADNGTGQLEVYTSRGWVGITSESPAAGVINATGGTVTSTGITPGNGFKYHVFHSPGTFTVTSGQTSTFDLLLIGGGGGAGSNNSGGGGAGGLIYIPSANSASAFTLTPGSYSVTIANGGAGTPGAGGGNAAGSPGGDSIFGTNPSPQYLIAKGGGGSGYWMAGNVPVPGGGAGGSGAGGPGNNTNAPSSYRNGAPATQPGQPGNSGTFGRGFVGGNGGYTFPSGDTGGGGGGGAGGAGVAVVSPGNEGSAPGGNGGNGYAIPVFPATIIAPEIPTSTPTGSGRTPGNPFRTDFTNAVGPTGLFGGGGGGGTGGGPGGDNGGAGGPGGGGEGGRYPAGPQPGLAGVPGVFGTGGGGGGGDNTDGGEGAKGICIIRYPVA